MFVMKFILLALFSFYPFFSPHAELRIEITQGLDKAVKIAVVPFAWKGKRNSPAQLDQIIANDLRISGRFEPLKKENMLSFPENESEIFVRDWRMLGAEYLVFGYLEPNEVEVKLHFDIFDVSKAAVVRSRTVNGLPKELRDMAHYVSDEIFEVVTGTEGSFSTQIMYVTAEKLAEEQRLYALNIADSDGWGVKRILESNEPILSATWSPDSGSVAYVSFELDGRPGVFLHDLSTDKREVLTRFAGLNVAPAFSPDGKTLALVLSKD